MVTDLCIQNASHITCRIDVSPVHWLVMFIVHVCLIMQHDTEIQDTKLCNKMGTRKTQRLMLWLMSN